MAAEGKDSNYDERPRNKFGLNPVSLVMMVVVAAAAGSAAMIQEARNQMIGVAAGGLVLALLFGLAPRVALEWERAVVLRLGRFTRLAGPGLFWVFPFVERIVMWVDLRVRTTTFAAEKTLTADTVPVDVDAVLFWQVKDAEKAALAVEDYRKAIAWAAQTALRDIIGKTHLAEMLTGREAIDAALKSHIDERTHDWGISVRSVEIRDVTIPPGLEDAMSRQAQAEREKLARVILGDAEVEIAAKFEMASLKYVNNPTAFQLRAMNILYEGMKEKGSLMVVPSATVDALSVGSMVGLAAWRGAQNPGTSGALPPAKPGPQG